MYYVGCVKTKYVSIENSNDSYVKLIGEFVNDARRIVEDAWDWSALRSTITVTTTEDNLFSYSMTGTNNSFKILDVINDTSNFLYAFLLVLLG